MARHDNHDYTKYHAWEYVHYLGCWWSPCKEQTILDRDPNEYVRLLKQLIEVNKHRDDQIGRWESLAAETELEKMGINSS